jgi:cation diffusion facilitator CzcD-associated flavoprotein CzcO
MLDWLIVGSGLHGTYLAIYLLGRRGLPRGRLRLLDPHEQPLALWRHFTANTGMTFLRSSHAHNLHFDPWSLATFARTQDGAALAQFIEPYGRPALDLFNAHADRLIQRYQLDRLRLVGRAVGLKRHGEGWCVETQAGTIEARRVILAIGSTETPAWPDWGRGLQTAGAPIHHIFDPAFRRELLPSGAPSIVVGGGITAAQTALSLAATSPGGVTLMMQHPPRIHDFDADPLWIDPRHLQPFHQETDYAERRAIIRAARHRGSMPPDVARDLQAAVLEGRLVRRMEHIETGTLVRDVPKRQIEFHLRNAASLRAEQVVLATGFDLARPGVGWLDPAIMEYDLPVAPDGYPIVDAALRWSPGLYVTGPLAELEVGPVARNLIGVRLAAERIGSTV